MKVALFHGSNRKTLGAPDGYIGKVKKKAAVHPITVLIRIPTEDAPVEYDLGPSLWAPYNAMSHKNPVSFAEVWDYIQLE
jgi:hypothetical protein